MTIKKTLSAHNNNVMNTDNVRIFMEISSQKYKLERTIIKARDTL